MDHEIQFRDILNNCFAFNFYHTAALSIYSIVYLNTHTDITGIDYLIGTLMMIVGFALMGRGTIYAAGMTLKDVKKKLKDKLTKK